MNIGQYTDEIDIAVNKLFTGKIISSGKSDVIIIKSYTMHIALIWLKSLSFGSDFVYVLAPSGYDGLPEHKLMTYNKFIKIINNQ